MKVTIDDLDDFNLTELFAEPIGLASTAAVDDIKQTEHIIEGASAVPKTGKIQIFNYDPFERRPPAQVRRRLSFVTADDTKRKVPELLPLTGTKTNKPRRRSMASTIILNVLDSQKKKGII